MQHRLNEMLKQKQFKIPIPPRVRARGGGGRDGHDDGADDDRLCLTHRNARTTWRERSRSTRVEHYRLAQRAERGG